MMDLTHGMTMLRTYANQYMQQFALIHASKDVHPQYIIRE